MDNQTTNNEIGIEIDLKRLVNVLLKRAWIVVLTAIIGAVGAYFITASFIVPQYTASTLLYINNSDISIGSTSLKLSTSDISASRGLVDTYIVILNTRETLTDVLDYAEVDMSVGQLKGMMVAGAVDKTEIFRVSITDTDPARAQKLADAVAQILPKRITQIVEGTSAKVAEAAVLPTNPSSPNYGRNIRLGLILGALLSGGIILAWALLDTTIRNLEDIAQVTAYPILAEVPDITLFSKGGSQYGYGAQGKQFSEDGKAPLVGGDVGFSVTEAYKLLRTKLLYSFADDQTCRVIGVTSSISGEGKSLTTINLAYALSQLNKRVLVIDCDMRRPTVYQKLPVHKVPGLSGFLSGQKQLQSLVQNCGIKGEEDAFHVIASGNRPPNPADLLSSERMKRLIEALREKYDYILLDLPPVCEVSDALIVGNVVDGMLLVVRQKLASRPALEDTVRQLEFVGARVLGLAFNATNTESAPYAKRYYRRGYRKYGNTYGRYAAKPDDQV